jgi:hypothetical protein
MAIDFSFLEEVAPKQEEPEVVVKSNTANITIRVDADCMMLCDGEYVEISLKAGAIAKTQLPIGQHLLEFISEENSNIKIEKMVDFPESDKNYLVIVNELKMAIAPPIPKEQYPLTPPQNAFLDQLNRMASATPLAKMQQTPPLPPSPPPFDKNK